MYLGDFWIPLIVGLLLLLLPSLFMKKNTSSTSQNKGKTFKRLGWLLIIVSAIFFFGNKLIAPSTQNIPSVEVLATEINRGLPKMMDPVTRLDEVTAGDKQLIYHITLMNYRGGYSELAEKIAKAHEYRDEFVRKFLDNGISLKFDYYSVDNFFITSVVLSPSSSSN
jgi:hypothetical protein